MRKEYRLISDFRRQTQTTIWKHLDAMAVNYAVYSSHLKGLGPFLTDFDVYLYCDASCMVVVCLDCCGQGEEQTYARQMLSSASQLIRAVEMRQTTMEQLARVIVREDKEKYTVYETSDWIANDDSLSGKFGY